MHSAVIPGNCFEVMASLPPAIAQVVFIDPPYNLGFAYGTAGKEADSLPDDVYLKRIEELFRLSVEKLTDNGSIFVLCPERWADEFGRRLTQMLPRRNRIIWRETFGQYQEQRFPLGHRHLFYHVSDLKRSPFYTDIGIRVESARMRAGDKRSAGPRVPDDVWEIPRLVGNAKERIGDHPCQLPESLLERVILISSREGQLVLDPMAGTGTTARVAQRLGLVLSHILQVAVTVLLSFVTIDLKAWQSASGDWT